MHFESYTNHQTIWPKNTTKLQMYHQVVNLDVCSACLTSDLLLLSRMSWFRVTGRPLKIRTQCGRIITV